MKYRIQKVTDSVSVRFVVQRRLRDIRNEEYYETQREFPTLEEAHAFVNAKRGPFVVTMWEGEV